MVKEKRDGFLYIKELERFARAKMIYANAVTRYVKACKRYNKTLK